MPEHDDPMMLLMAKLTGTNLAKPHQPIPYNLWGKANPKQIDPLYEKQCEGRPRKEWMKIRSGITRELFGKLDKSTQDYWAGVAKWEHEATMATWRNLFMTLPSTDPVDRQK
jgi:hypothetical protein